jgi:cyclopropane fatty-acyl-phospholipid synthase-like methyltransferase
VTHVDPAFDHASIQRYYNRHTSGFIALGTGGSTGVIHRAVWAPGVTTPAEAFHYVDDRIADAIAARPPSVASAAGHAAMPRLHVVDLGCGVGATLCHVARRLDARATGVTLSPLQARLATRRIEAEGLADRVTCLEASFDALPPSVPPADAAYAIESFAHAPDPAGFFAEAARIVRPGGLLLICDDVRRPGGGAGAQRTVERFTRGWHLNTLLTSGAVVTLAEAAGFEHGSTVNLTPHLVRRRLRDRVLDTTLGWLPLGATPLGPVLGGAALQTCLARGWTAYELLTFQRRA